MEWTQRSDFRLGLGLLASAVLHGALALFWGHLIEMEQIDPSARADSQRFELENLSQDQIRQIRQVGVRGGSKEGFNAPMPRGQAQEQNQKKAPESPPAPQKQLGEENISLQDLAARPGSQMTQGESQQSSRAKDRDASALRISQEQKAAQRIARQQRMIQGDVLKELSASSRAREVIQKTGFNLQFDPPEGIPEDELNSVEKIFYSFQRRTFTSYVNTFISNYHQMSLQSSKLKRVLQNQSHDMLGRVEFNHRGETASIRVMQGSPIEEVQNLFEKTLKDLKLPNPPQDLLREDGRFVIYYRLKIND